MKYYLLSWDGSAWKKHIQLDFEPASFDIQPVSHVATFTQKMTEAGSTFLHTFNLRTGEALHTNVKLQVTKPFIGDTSFPLTEFSL